MSNPIPGPTDCSSGFSGRIYTDWATDVSGQGNGLVSPLTGAPQGMVRSLCYAIAKAIADELAADGTGAPSGTIAAFAGSAAPSGWLLCQGQAVSRTTYATLFGVIGTTYGAGDGSTTFNLPDGRGRSLIGAGQGVGLTNRALAATGGEEAHALSVAELAAHNHGVTDPGHTHSYVFNWTGANNNLWHQNATNGLGPGDGSTPNGSGGAAIQTNTTGISIQNNGSGTAHNNLQPFLAVNWIIAT